MTTSLGGSCSSEICYPSNLAIVPLKHLEALLCPKAPYFSHMEGHRLCPKEPALKLHDLTR